MVVLYPLASKTLAKSRPIAICLCMVAEVCGVFKGHGGRLGGMMSASGMMSARSRVVYGLAVTLAVALTAGYVVCRGLVARYQELQAGRSQVVSAQRECEVLEKAVESAYRRVRELENNPFAMEAASRNSKGFVRPDEVVYRLEEAPTEAP